MALLTETEFAGDKRREAAAAAPRDARSADVPPPSPRCAEMLQVLNQILDAETAASEFA
jgi:hypothetical protein